MNKLPSMLVCLLILLAPALLAEQEFTAKWTFKQAEGNKEVKDILLNLVVIDKQTGKDRMISSFVRTNPIIISLPRSEYVMQFKLDDLQTPGKDYYAEQTLLLEKNIETEVIVFPVGSIQGVVYDKLNNLVSKAALKMECDKEYGEKITPLTDKVGAFAVNHAPIGDCTITATAHGAAGAVKVNIEKGKTQTVEIRLDKAVISESSNAATIILTLVILGILGSSSFFLWRRYKKKKTVNHLQEAHHTKATEKQQEEKLSKRTKDILNTLNDREKKVVSFLLANNHHSTQAKIRYETGIPKTTLVRIFLSLQNKKVIAVEIIGKLKKIKLTDWFLEKEAKDEKEETDHNLAPVQKKD